MKLCYLLQVVAWNRNKTNPRKYENMAGCFHRCCGSMATVSNNGRTAQRNHPAQEFNNGVVISAEPMRDNHLFEVKIDRKVHTALLPVSI